MKTVEITFNPYFLRTDVLIDGEKPKPNSKLNFGKLRIQEWAATLADVLFEECCDRNYEIKFSGTQSDYDDLKDALLNSSPDFQWTFAGEDIKDSVSDVEAKVEEIFKEILAGPVEQLKDKSICEAFKRAKNQEFEVNVVATMSSGKSTLINALLGKKLMPVSNMATTATIVKIIDTKQDNFSAKAYDTDGNLLKEDLNITYETMKEWNKDTSISSIEICGRIPCVESVGMRLVLIDTPGPNNSQDESHRRMTYDMLAASDKSLVLFVMNATQLNVDDQKNLMDYVCDCMQKGGKQSRERYIFAVNKMDDFDPEDDDPKEALEQAKKVLEDNNITAPNLFPVSAQVALECRDKPKNELPRYINKLEKYPEMMKFDSYYEYNHLPFSVQHDIQEMLQTVENEGEVEIHTGIVSIEQAIGLYISKYARSIKVKDLVDSFNNRLTELQAVASLQADIRQNKDRKVQLDKQIEEINTKIESGKSAQTLSKSIDEKDLSGSASEEIGEFVNGAKSRLDKIIYQYSKDTKVPKEEADRRLKPDIDACREILCQLDSQVAKSLEKAYKMLFDDIIKEYQKHLTELELSADSDNFGLRPLDFVAEELANVDSIVSQHVVTDDESYDEIRTKKVKGKKKKNWFWTPWNWFSERYEEKTIEYSCHVPKNVDYVDMFSVTKEYIKPLQQQLVDAKEAVKKHAQEESDRIKADLKAKLSEIENVLQRKLEELKSSTDSVAQTQREIEEQEANLKWMKNIIQRVNKLINF